MYFVVLLFVCYIFVVIVMYMGLSFIIEGVIMIGVVYLFIRLIVSFFDLIINLFNFIF